MNAHFFWMPLPRQHRGFVQILNATYVLIPSSLIAAEHFCTTARQIPRMWQPWCNIKDDIASLEQRIIDMTEPDLIRPERDCIRLLDEGKFMILRSRATGSCIFYPRVAEPSPAARIWNGFQRPATGSSIRHRPCVNGHRRKATTLP